MKKPKIVLGPWAIPFIGAKELIELNELAESWAKGRQDLANAIARAKQAKVR